MDCPHTVTMTNKDGRQPGPHRHGLCFKAVDVRQILAACFNPETSLEDAQRNERG